MKKCLISLMKKCKLKQDIFLTGKDYNDKIQYHKYTETGLSNC